MNATTNGFKSFATAVNGDSDSQAAMNRGASNGDENDEKHPLLRFGPCLNSPVLRRLSLADLLCRAG